MILLAIAANRFGKRTTRREILAPLFSNRFAFYKGRAQGVRTILRPNFSSLAAGRQRTVGETTNEGLIWFPRATTTDHS